MDKDLSACQGFAWDAGKAEKSWRKHGVSRSECEQVFFNRPLLVVDDETHSHTERRYYALGIADMGRRLFLVFTVRGTWIRVIFARDMSRCERLIYEEKSNS